MGETAARISKLTRSVEPKRGVVLSLNSPQSARSLAALRTSRIRLARSRSWRERIPSLRGAVFRHERTGDAVKGAPARNVMLHNGNAGRPPRLDGLVQFIDCRL